ATAWNPNANVSLAGNVGALTASGGDVYAGGTFSSVDGTPQEGFAKFGLTDTPPTVTSLAANSLSASGATLRGTVNPHNSAARYHFDWGTTTGYGQVVPVPDGPAGSGSATVPVS